MVILIGNSLGERQRNLNKQVEDAAAKKMDFEKLKEEPSTSDIDILFKIDLASKYKNVDYLLEILKSGDSLYISRVLKCTWLYDEEYSKYINVNFLHHNIFPSMPFKIKRKFLTAISMHVRNVRAESFFVYCSAEKLDNIAMKFLTYSSETFKLDYLKKALDCNLKPEEFYKNFFGNSFTLVKAVMEQCTEYLKSKLLYSLRYLISVSENDYLDMLEKYDTYDKVIHRFGLRISANILTKHKSRCLKHPLLYMSRLKTDLITKYLTVEEAKTITVTVLPATSEQFWNEWFRTKYDFLINKIPASERFEFIKKIFEEKYPGKEFEMSVRFFDMEYFSLMSADEREAWALRHIEKNSEFFGVRRNYMWYKYVRFDKAFPEIKKYILKTPDFKDRHAIVEVLVSSVRNQTDMQTFLNYYYDRHVNEAPYHKEQFIRSIIYHHNIFEFNDDCWTCFNKLLHSMKVYNTDERCRSEIIICTAMIYHIIHNITLPKSLKEYILNNQICWSHDLKMLYEKISKENKEKVYQSVVKVYIDMITTLKSVEHKDDQSIETYVMRYINFLEEHEKTSDDCPDMIIEIVNTHWDYFEYCSLFKKKRKMPLTECDLIRHLKKDTKLVVDQISEVKDRISGRKYPELKINTFLKKIKVYFPNDITKDVLKIYTDALTTKDIKISSGVCSILVYGIFQLADDKTKIDFLTKYTPKESKINHGEIDEHFLHIQEGICRVVSYSRPPVPLSNVLKYITGDYLSFCLPMFQSYQARLPPPLLEEFVLSLIESPVSIQKHALRLVFQCFNTESVKKIVSDSWKRTRNVSLRFILYQSLFNKICGEDDKAQAELFEVLQQMTAGLNEDDDVNIFRSYMTNNRLPPRLLGPYIRICWQTVSKFPEKTENFQIKETVIQGITYSIHLVDENIVKEIVEEHVHFMLDKMNIRPSYENAALNNLNITKWKLVATYIIHFAKDIKNLTNILGIVTFIVNKSVEMWHREHDKIFTYRKFCRQFVQDILTANSDKNSVSSVPIFENILKILKDKLPLTEIYRIVWSLELSILETKSKEPIELLLKNETNDPKELLKTSVYNYGKNVGDLIKTNVDFNSYFASTNGMIGDLINNSIHNIEQFIRSNKNFDNVKNVNFNAAEGLLEVHLVETHLLALNILPRRYDSDNHTEEVLNKINKIDSEEVKFCFYDKFVESTF